MANPKQENRSDDARGVGVARVDMKFEIVVIPVSAGGSTPTTTAVKTSA
jgi:hypothetical protein